MSAHLKKGVLLVVFAVTFSLLGFFVGTGVYLSTALDTTGSAAIIQVAEPGSGPVLTSQEQTFATIYQRVSPSVVAISVVSDRGRGGVVSGSGSGFVIDQEGHIVTNYHVVQGATEITVNFLDGTITRAEIIGLDADSDVAVIQVNRPANELQPVEFGNVDDLVVGQTVLAIGSPFGQRWTLTSGIVSALERRISGLSGYAIGSAIQTDTPINPGNSGGPLLNLNGQVVGVNSQIFSESGVNTGVGFAIPSNLVARVADELITTGQVNYSFIGINGSDISLSVIESLNLPNNTQGVVVGTIVAGSPAERSGLRSAMLSSTDNGLASADIITAIDGQPINSFNALIAYLARYTAPGDTVTLTVLRDGTSVNLTVTLSARPGR